MAREGLVGDSGAYTCDVIMVVMIASWGIDPSEGLLTTKGSLAVGSGKQRGLAKNLPVV